MPGAEPKPSSSNISADEHDLQLCSQSFVPLRRTSVGTPRLPNSLRPRWNVMLISLENRV